MSEETLDTTTRWLWQEQLWLAGRAWVVQSEAEAKLTEITQQLQKERAAGHAARSWPEDFPHENGRYFVKCVHCGKRFSGHKRRVTCKLCSSHPHEVSEDTNDCPSNQTKSAPTTQP